MVIGRIPQTVKTEASIKVYSPIRTRPNAMFQHQYEQKRRCVLSQMREEIKNLTDYHWLKSG